MKYPERYDGDGSLETFRAQVLTYLRPGAAVLDVGGGQMPTIPPHQRPKNCYYVGLDISAKELRLAPDGSYSATFVGDAREYEPALSGQFDVVVSFQVFEHVKQLDQVFQHLHRYIKPGGVLLTQLSGRFAVFALLNQVIPHRVSCWLMEHLLGRSPGLTFPAYYDRCWYSAIRRLSSEWEDFKVTPIYTGGDYFRFSSILQRLYLLYEGWSMRSPNLATHYRIEAKSSSFR